MSTAQLEGINGLLAQIESQRVALEASQCEHRAELEKTHEAACAWVDHCVKLELALEAIEILYRCHDHPQAGHAMDVVRQIAHAASNLPRPERLPDIEIPF